MADRGAALDLDRFDGRFDLRQPAVPVPPRRWAQQVNAGVALHFSFEFAEPERFAGRIRTRSFGELGLFGVACRRHTVHRVDADLDRGDDASFLLTLQLSGSKRLVQHGRTATVRPGEFALYDSEQPLAMDVSDDYRSVNMRFPKSGVGRRDARAFPELCARSFPADAGFAPVLWSAVVAANAVRDAGPAGDLLAGNVVGLAVTVLRARLGLRPPAGDPRTRRLRRARAHIEARLADPALSVPAVAAATHVSVRHLHQLFDPTGYTVAGWIRHRRVEECRRDLTDPALRELPVAAVGARWGFTTASHFGAVFKAGTGMAPGEYRDRFPG
jgi:AraC-like DNA-binding protein